MAVKTVQAIINGQTYNLTLNASTGKYEATINAPSVTSYNVNAGHYYPVTIKATDDAGNTAAANDSDATMGSALRLYVKETVKPTIAVTYPTTGSQLSVNTMTVTWQVRDTGSGINPNTIGLTIDSGSKITGNITKTAVTGGYNCSYAITTALTDGSHTIKFDVSDYDGNAATQVSTIFKVDTIPPTLTLSSPADNLITNQKTVVVSGTTSDSSGITSLTIKINNGTAQEIHIGINGEFATTLTLQNGENTITVTATDGVGRVSAITRTVKCDIYAPVISNPVIAPNPVNTGKLFTISVTVVD